MIELDKMGPKVEKGQSVYTLDSKGLIHGKVTGVADEGFNVRWDDLDEETQYDFPDVTFLWGDFILECDTPRPVYNSCEEYWASIDELRRSTQEIIEGLK